MPKKKLPAKTLEGTIARESKKSSDVFNPETLTAIQVLAACCFTDKEIALELGMSVQKLAENKKKYQAFAEAVELGRMKAKKKWGKALLRKIDEGDMQAIKFYGTHVLKMSAPRADEDAGKGSTTNIVVFSPEDMQKDAWQKMVEEAKKRATEAEPQPEEEKPEWMQGDNVIDLPAITLNPASREIPQSGTS